MCHATPVHIVAGRLALTAWSRATVVILITQPQVWELLVCAIRAMGEQVGHPLGNAKGARGKHHTKYGSTRGNITRTMCFCKQVPL